MQKCTKKEEGKGRKEAPRAYWHEVVLYADDLTAADTLTLVEENFPEWVAITHDMDTKEGGELKKEHTHVLMKSRSGRSASAVAKLLRVPVERVELKSNGQGAMAYLTHSTEKARLDGKHVYPVEALRGPLAAKAAEAARAETGAASEAVQVLQILDWIDAHGEAELISTADLARWCAASGVWAPFRRAGVIFRGCVEEHNNRAREVRGARREASGSGYDPLAFAKLKAAGLAAGEGAAV